MNSPILDERFADGLRSALVQHAAADSRRGSRGRNLTRGAAALLAVAALGGGGVAIAAAVLDGPGATHIETKSEPVTFERQGSAEVRLGQAPSDADHVEVDLTCLSAGRFAASGGGEFVCGRDDIGDSTNFLIPLAPRRESLAIDADPNARWRLVATYVDASTLDLGTNESGQTFGAESSEKGRPDLVAVVATNGKDGYAHAQDLVQPTGRTPEESLAWQQTPLITVMVPVYSSDGKTRIGEFRVERRQAAQDFLDKNGPVTPETPIPPRAG